MRDNRPVTNKEHLLNDDQSLISVTDLKGNITFCNDSFVKVSGFTREALLGQAHNTVRHPAMPEEAFRDLWDTVQAGEPWVGLVKNRCENGDHYWVQANVVPIRSGTSGEIVGYLSVRTKPTRPEVAAAEALYDQLNREAEAGRRQVGLHRGKAVRLGPLGRLARRLPVGLFGLPLIVQAVSAAAIVAATLTLPVEVAAFVAVLGVLTSTLLTRHLNLSRLESLVVACNRLAAGDLSTTITHHSHGTVGAMELALNQLSVTLRTISADTRSDIQDLRGSIQEIAASNHELSERTENQASSLVETAAAAEEINGTAQHSAASVQQAAQRADEMSTQAHRSREAVNLVSQSMQAIDESSRKVGEIIHVIEGVAFQTNILALNAAVEAARAGEAGRGFAVVAAEVRSLAHRTSEAAKEIKQLILQSADRVATGTANSVAAGERMAEAMHTVETVASLLSEIRNAADEQQIGNSQISQSVNHMDRIAQQNAAMVEELAAASDTLQTQVAHAGATLSLLRLQATDPTLAARDAAALRRDNTTSSAEQGFDFKAAIAAHGKWKVTLRNAALKGETLDADSLSRDDCCALGKMVYGPEGQRWGDSPVFVDLVEKHRVFHQRAGSIAQAINSGQGEKAARMLETGTPFSEATHSVIGALHKLMRATANERPKEKGRMALSAPSNASLHSRPR